MVYITISYTPCKLDKLWWRLGDGDDDDHDEGDEDGEAAVQGQHEALEATTSKLRLRVLLLRVVTFELLMLLPALLVLLVHAALVHLQAELHDDVEDDPDDQDPGGPPRHPHGTKVHADEDVRDWGDGWGQIKL